MADFTSLIMEANHGIQAAPVWVEVGPGANKEVRWNDQDDQKDIASAAWPAMIRPAATAIVSYTYAYTADAVGNGFISNAGAAACPAYAETNYMWARWNWDNTGTFASPPIFTAYPSGAHGAIVRDDGSLLGGKIADTGGGGYSYLKGNAFGRVVSAGAPAAAPAAAPVVGDGTVGSVSPGAGANWLANFQSLQGDNDWITAPFTPAATTADQWNLHFALFTGPNETPALYLVVMTLKYTWT
ncbi:hypothetical protein KKH23_05120 [Patescibacteria group bacterium]|nr:hypothetical protein [Patescibacteria group bacterium]MBU1067509.1 hypothetical protein [Patescibacteria group bacterium]